jgi:putative sterol carrier protein
MVDGEGDYLEEDDRDDDTPAPSTDVKSGRAFLLDQLPQRGSRANPRLRANLAGSIRLELSDLGQQYLCSLKGDVFEVLEDKSSPADCTIKLSEGDLLRIIHGKLNAQLAMLSEKIQVEGQLSLAVYFFNLVSPKSLS